MGRYIYFISYYYFSTLIGLYDPYGTDLPEGQYQSRFRQGGHVGPECHIDDPFFKKQQLPHQILWRWQALGRIRLLATPSFNSLLKVFSHSVDLTGQGHAAFLPSSTLMTLALSK